ncbi:hypothetical protein GS3922_06585 [Geobacillus subterraneus]|uniref:Uncharacterized protein n=3 Tax=Anoxybacillaceae TaxID=3120669 RepID=A0ABM6AFR7_9BACL|nr:hypothetical protein GS3922_06585 [Geobacillus subterraneus]KZS24649.1 hypothetical protein A5418_06025 [Geobacillus subterraneus]OXB90552.1 hypothetical protein B9L21_06525 [Geobacillus uzenensis]
METMKQDMETMKQDMETMKQDMDTMKQEVQAVKQKVDKLEKRMDKQEEELHWLKEQVKENTEMVKAVRDNQLEQRSIQDAMRHDTAAIHGEIVDIRTQMATKEDISLIHQRLDYQISRIARTEEEIHLLKTAN